MVETLSRDSKVSAFVEPIPESESHQGRNVREGTNRLFAIVNLFSTSRNHVRQEGKSMLGNRERYLDYVFHATVQAGTSRLLVGRSGKKKKTIASAA